MTSSQSPVPLGICPPVDFTTKPTGGIHLLDEIESPSLPFHRRSNSITLECSIAFPPHAREFQNDTIAFVAGQQFSHFGHFLSESCSRLSNYEALKLSSVPLIWYAPAPLGKNRMSSVLRDFVVNYFSLDVSLAHTFTEPTVVRRALLTEQSTIYGAPNCSPIFVEACNSRQDRYFQRIPEQIGTLTRIIIGRRNFATKIAGEKVIFNKLKNYGFVEIQPESLSLHNQVSILRNARSIIFTEGSFVHWLDLLGQLPGEIGFLQRRPTEVRGTAHQISLVRSRFRTHEFSGDPDFQLSAIANDTVNSIGIYRVEHLLSFIKEAIGLRIPLTKNSVVEYLEEVENDALSLYQYFEKKRSIRNRLRHRTDFEAELSGILKSIGS